jgi:hypothetical protein
MILAAGAITCVVGILIFAAGTVMCVVMIMVFAAGAVMLAAVLLRGNFSVGTLYEKPLHEKTLEGIPMGSCF